MPDCFLTAPKLNEQIKKKNNAKTCFAATASLVSSLSEFKNKQGSGNSYHERPTVLLPVPFSYIIISRSKEISQLQWLALLSRTRYWYYTHSGMQSYSTCTNNALVVRVRVSAKWLKCKWVCNYNTQPFPTNMLSPLDSVKLYNKLCLMLLFSSGPKDQRAWSLATEPDQQPHVPAGALPGKLAAGARVCSQQGPGLPEGNICPG